MARTTDQRIRGGATVQIVMATIATKTFVRGTTQQNVIAITATQGVYPGVTCQRVAQSVASTIDGTAAGEGQVLDIGTQRVGGAGLDRVGAGP